MSALSRSSADHARVLPAMFQTTTRSRCWTEGVVKGVGVVILSFGFLDITGARLRLNVRRRFSDAAVSRWPPRRPSERESVASLRTRAPAPSRRPERLLIHQPYRTPACGVLRPTAAVVRPFARMRISRVAGVQRAVGATDNVDEVHPPIVAGSAASRNRRSRAGRLPDRLRPS